VSLLGELGDVLGVGASLADAAAALRDAADPYELGFALAMGEGGTSALLSYNPRRRGGGARQRMLLALAAQDLPLAPARAAFAWLPEVRASTVLGLEWRRQGVDATLYLEELSSGFDAAGVQRQTARVAEALGLPVPDWGADGGDPYILAVDLTRSGVTALKTYRQAATVPEDLAALFDDAEPANGWILQRRHPAGAGAVGDAVADGSTRPLKVYKTFAYEAGGGGAGAAAEARAALARFGDQGIVGPVTDLLAGCRVTSIGLRLGAVGVVSATAYWCLERGAGADLR